jgi:Zn-dependent protease
MLEGLDLHLLALWFVAFLFSTTCHEAAHALAARWGGDDTAYEAGQASLNPLPHVAREPLGMVIVPIAVFVMSGFMIGWASAPYDPDWAERHPRRAGLMAASGPLTNLLLALLGLGVLRLLVGVGWGVAPEVATLDRLIVPVGDADPLALAVARLLSIMVVLNALLGVFNLLPLPPLDGAAVIEGLGGRGAAQVMTQLRELPMAGLIGLLLAWQLFRWLSGPIFAVVLRLAHPGLFF